MFDSLVQTIAGYPYLGVALVFLVCGLGFPLPEELVLIAAGYVCAKFPDKASLHLMMVWSAGSILTFDLVPFVLGRVFGARLLRVRWLRLVVTRKRLANFDRWFRRRGDLVIFIARFLAGLRVIAFFTAGTMKMRWRRFLLLDGLGIVIIVPLLVWLGHRGAGVIDDVITRVQAVERGILWSALGALVVLGLWYWLWRRKRSAARPRPTETFVEPQLPVELPGASGSSANGSGANGSGVVGGDATGSAAAAPQGPAPIVGGPTDDPLSEPGSDDGPDDSDLIDIDLPAEPPDEADGPERLELPPDAAHRRGDD